MSRLIASAFVETPAEAEVAARRAWDAGADAVELRLDVFDGDGADLAVYLCRHRDRTWILTCRSAEEGGSFRGDTMSRVSLLLGAARGTGAYVDFELADFERSSNIRQKILLATGPAEDAHPRLILSAHDFRGPPADPEALLARFEGAAPAATWKLAYVAPTIHDTFLAFDLMRRHRRQMIAVAMGEPGLWTRVLAKKLDAFGSFASIGPSEATAQGQLAVEEMVNRYRWGDIDGDTRVFGVIGDPVAHSLSPSLFNRWFAEAGINAVYLPLRVQGGDDGLRRFLDGCRSRPWLDIGGFSVTTPHKHAALRWADRDGGSMCRGIGAANTLVMRDGRLEAYNTDCYAAIGALADALCCDRTELQRLRFDVLGAGGAARALVYGLRELGCEIAVYARDTQKANTLAEEFSLRGEPWSQVERRRGDVLVNCTPIGLWPNLSASPVSPETLAGCRLVFDMIYNPGETQLLRDAAGEGIATLNGLEMFVRQAAMQFELWTGRSPDVGSAAATLVTELASLRETPT